jgi:hypothetical protein
MPTKDIEEMTRAYVQSRTEAAVQTFFEDKDFSHSEIDIVGPDGTDTASAFKKTVHAAERKTARSS